MKTLTTNPRVLLCTVYRRDRRDYWDYISENVYSYPRVFLERRESLGLRFLKQNVPEIEICEYPLWHEYVKRLKEGWDVVGFSFFENEIGEVLEMIREARRHGVHDIWAGCYGALDPVIPNTVDRVFTGASEDALARVFGKRVKDDEVEHPVLLAHLGFVPTRIRHLTFGVLYTEHGCPFKCTFCQTPVFDTKSFKVNYESIQRVVEYYKKIGINDLFVGDELFGLDPEHGDRLTRLFARNKMRWWAQSRAVIFLKNLDTWYKRGLRFPLIGVETMSQSALDGINKRQKLAQIYEYSRKSREKKGLYRMVYYMIGYENLNLEETIQDAINLKRADFDAHQVNVLTPFPRTPLWHKVRDEYGLFKVPYRQYDAKHLVWNHPHISKLQMHYLLNSLIGFLNKPVEIYGKGFSRIIWERLRSKGLDFIWRDLIKGPMAAAMINDRKFHPIP